MYAIRSYYDLSADFATELIANLFAYLDEALSLARVLPLSGTARRFAAAVAFTGVDAHTLYGLVTGCRRHRCKREHGRSSYNFV